MAHVPVLFSYFYYICAISAPFVWVMVIQVEQAEAIWDMTSSCLPAGTLCVIVSLSHTTPDRLLLLLAY